MYNYFIRYFFRIWFQYKCNLKLNNNNLLTFINLIINFDSDKYRDNNTDLFDLSKYQLYEHYFKHGINESSRNYYQMEKPKSINDFIKYFIEELYIDQYKTSFNISEDLILKIIKNFPFFNLSEYRLVNEDLNNFSDNELYIHYLHHGIIENRLISLYGKRKTIIYITHLHTSGGTEVYVNDLKNLYKFFNIQIIRSYEEWLYLWNNIYDIILVHINSIVSTNITIYNLIKVINDCKNRDIPIYLTVHDFYWINTVTYSPDYNKLEITNDKLVLSDSKLNLTVQLITLFDLVIYPTKYIYEIYNRYLTLFNYKERNYKIIYHNDIELNLDYLNIPPIINNVINIAYVGAFIPHKGSEIFKDLSYKFKTYNFYKLKYHVFGSIHSSICKSIKFHGEYKNNNILKLLIENNIHCIIFPGMFPETYGYTISRMIMSGLPILYRDIGAHSERLTSHNSNKMFPFTDDLVKNIPSVTNTLGSFIQYIINNVNITCDKTIHNPIIVYNNWYVNSYIPELNKDIKNLFIITSVLEPVDTQFSYKRDRSVYTRGERLKQLISTLMSIRVQCEEFAYIVVIEATKLKDYEINYIQQYCDLILLADDKTCSIVNDIYKGKGECALLYYCISQLKTRYNYVLKNITRIFKLSGRYYLTEQFNINRYINLNNIFRIVEHGSIFEEIDKKLVYTFLYKIDINYLDKFLEILKMGIEVCTDSVEEYFMKNITDINYVPILGISGNISVCGTLITK